MARKIIVPPSKMPLWCHFSAALCQKAVARDADGVEGCFAILLKHCADDPGVALLKEVCNREAADVATTILAALPDDARRKMTEALNKDREQRDAVIRMVREKQQLVREVVAEFASKHPELQKVVA